MHLFEIYENSDGYKWMIQYHMYKMKRLAKTF